jgi:hypothetical protein
MTLALLSNERLSFACPVNQWKYICRLLALLSMKILHLLALLNKESMTFACPVK